MFGTVKLIKTTDPDKYEYSGYDIGFDARRSFLLCDGASFSKIVIIFGADMSSSVHIDNKKKDILTDDRRSDRWFRDNTLTAEKEYFINFAGQQDKICLNLHYKIEWIVIYLLMMRKYINSK